MGAQLTAGNEGKQPGSHDRQHEPGQRIDQMVVGEDDLRQPADRQAAGLGAASASMK